MLKKIALATALVAGITASAVALAGGPRGEHGSGHGMPFKQLDLSEVQREQVRKIMQDHRKASEPLREEQKALRKGMATLKPGSADYAQQVAKLQDQAAKVARDRVKNMADLKSQINVVLTDEQRAKLAKREQNFDGRHHRKHRHKG